MSVTHDEAANMACAAAKLSDDYNWASQVCMAHRLDTVIRHAIEDSRPVEKLLTASRRLVGHFRHSAVFTELLCKKQIELDTTKQAKKVIRDVSTHWNSSFFMLHRLIELQRFLTIIPVDSVLTPKKDYRTCY